MGGREIVSIHREYEVLRMNITRTSKVQQKNKRANRINGKKISMIPVSDNQHNVSPVSYDVVKKNLQLVTQETLKTATVNKQA